MFSANKIVFSNTFKRNQQVISVFVLCTATWEQKNYFFRLIGCNQCMLRRQNCNSLSFSVSSTRNKFIIALLVFNHCIFFFWFLIMVYISLLWLLYGIKVFDYHGFEDFWCWCFTALFLLLCSTATRASSKTERIPKSAWSITISYATCISFWNAEQCSFLAIILLSTQSTKWSR